METMGNANGAYVYEHAIPKNFHRPNKNNGYELEQFIRAKYERKSYFSENAFTEVMSGARKTPQEKDNQVVVSRDEFHAPSSSPQEFFTPAKKLISDDILFGNSSAPPDLEAESSSSSFPFVDQEKVNARNDNRNTSDFFSSTNSTAPSSSSSFSSEGFDFINQHNGNQENFFAAAPQANNDASAESILDLYSSASPLVPSQAAPFQQQQPMAMLSAQQNKGNYNVDLSDVYGRRQNNTVVQQGGYFLGAQGYNRNLNQTNQTNQTMNMNLGNRTNFGQMNQMNQMNLYLNSKKQQQQKQTSFVF
jgi:hypothetical protein